VNPIKGVALAAVIAVVNPAMAVAKDATGIYLTAEDYKAARLTSESDCGSPGHKTELHDILRKPFIDVTHEGTSRRYEKRAIYGFRSCSGRDYRFVDNDEYEIVESKALSIYVHEVPARNPNDTSRDRATSRDYFFSVGAAGEVFPLTIANVRRAFPGNHAFHDALDATFHTDEDLTQYDTFHRMFKINRLLVANR
jgi:hypothetical protein